MPRLDPAAVDTVTRFAQSMGLTALANDDQSFGFDFADSGRLSVMADDTSTRVLVSLTRRVVLDDIVPLMQFAAISGHDTVEDLVLHAGVNRVSQPVLTLAIEPRDFTVPRLEAAFASLRRAFTTRGL